MKNFSQTVTLILAVILIALLAALGHPTQAAQAAGTPVPTLTATAQPTELPTEEPELICDRGRTIQVSGSAMINVTPDRALIQLGIQSNGSTPQKVEAANSATVNRIIAALKKLGIEQKDIATDWYVIQPIYDDYSSLKIKGYRIHNMLAITLRDISKVNSTLSAALTAGANEVINVEFYLSDLRKYRDQARELAMKAAKEKAEDLATAAGSGIGCVININENTWSYFNGGGWWGGTSSSRESNLWSQNAIQNAAPTGGADGALTETGPVTLGQISVKAEISASFSLK